MGAGKPTFLRALLLPALLGAIVIGGARFDAWSPDAWTRPRGDHTLTERLGRHGPAVQARLAGVFASAGLNYPPAELLYVAFKQERRLEVYARGTTNAPWRHVSVYPILALSGTLGPKLRQGDRQVPEGFYRVESLNPDSRFHLSMRLDYPNAFDRDMARLDRREHLGSDIMIHGGAASIGCLALGDQAAEDLFVLAALATDSRVRVLISPLDFRDWGAGWQAPHGPAWLERLYAGIRSELAGLPKPAASARIMQ
ncbi:MAG: L,D-transpeptidase family protein [Hylemonella sp.]|nr:L,D-transpeptidase family protein [Hylemonella sp.]MDH5708551.1 L,D-transpeptidase family protein [Hylemonella sp.]